MVKRTRTALHCRETSLQLSDDEDELVLSRYIELYSPDGMQWVERSHRVSVNALMRWMIAHGQPQPVLHGEDGDVQRVETAE